MTARAKAGVGPATAASERSTKRDRVKKDADSTADN